MKIRSLWTAGATMAVSGLLAAFVTPGEHSATPPPLNFESAETLAASLGDSDTAGVYYRNGRPVIAVTDADTATAVRDAGGVAEVVKHSAATLESVHADLDELAGIPNTTWGVDPAGNTVTVGLYDGVPPTDRSRVLEAARAHGDAVRIEENSGKIEPTATYYMRGGLGIFSRRTCSAAFNVQNGAGKKFLLTAGHCMLGGNYEWERKAGQVYLGTVHKWNYEPEDWALVQYKNPEVVAVGSLQLRDESEQSITTSRDPRAGENVKRLGTMSQDLSGKVIRTSTTVNYDTGATVYHMIETDLCTRMGDSGGALYSDTYALGITSGGNYVDEPCGDSDAQVGRRSFYQNVQRTVSREGYEVY
ncbi:S1 family peptidase [Streptomyces sp. NPDC102283]|uniref:S1 family peptidase n=1 Tax=Streptomyces sp. NPDC102283 TaxID=3366155 RepID=UPI0037FB9730